MAYPVAAGVSSFSGTMIPEIWSQKLQVKLYDNTFLSQVTNTDYEGEIRKKGDKVIVRTVPDITIRDHTDGQALTYENVTPTIVEMLIDKGKYWAFPDNLVTSKQSDIDYVTKFADDAAMQLKISIETAWLADIYDDVATGNYGTTAGVKSSAVNLGTSGSAIGLTKSNILEYIVDCGTVLDEQNVPEDNRWMILPPLFCGMIKKSDLKDASLTGDGTSVMRNGRLGMIDRFTIYCSNLVDTTSDTGTKYNIPFGHPMACSFATQLTVNETLKNPNAFGDLRRGLQVYGYKMIQSKAMGWLYAYKA